MMSEEFSIFRPRHHLPASSATEPLPPDIADYPRELPEASGVGRSSVILVVAPEHGIDIASWHIRSKDRSSFIDILIHGQRFSEIPDLAQPLFVVVHVSFHQQNSDLVFVCTA